jgi:hypothetical protein
VKFPVEAVVAAPKFTAVSIPEVTMKGLAGLELMPAGKLANVT